MILALKFIYMVALSIWTGQMVFFSFIAAPRIFKTLKRDDAARAAGRITAGYYLIMYICAAAALASSVILILELGAAGKELLWEILTVIILAAMAVGAVYSGFFLKRRMDKVAERIPSFEQASEDDPARIEYDKLHKTSGWLNAAILVLALVAIFLTSLRIKF